MPVLSGQLFPLGRRGVTVPPLAPPPPLPGLNLRKCKAPYPATMETRMGRKGRRDRGGRGKDREGERSGGVEEWDGERSGREGVRGGKEGRGEKGREEREGKGGEGEKKGAI